MVLNQNGRNLFIWVGIVLAVLMVFNMFQQAPSNQQRLSYTEFLNRVDGGQIVSVTIQGSTLIGKTADNRDVSCYAPRDISLINRLMEKNIEIRVDPPDEQSWYVSVFVS